MEHIEPIRRWQDEAEKVWVNQPWIVCGLQNRSALVPFSIRHPLQKTQRNNSIGQKRVDLKHRSGSGQCGAQNYFQGREPDICCRCTRALELLRSGLWRRGAVDLGKRIARHLKTGCAHDGRARLQTRRTSVYTQTQAQQFLCGGN